MRRWMEALRLPPHYALLAWASRRVRPAPEGTPRKIMILGYEAIGDLIFLLPALRALRRAFPEAKVVFLADRYPGTEELLPATGLVDHIWLYEHAELARWGVRREIRRRMAESRFDALIATHPTPMREFAFAALAAPTRIGHCRPLEAPRSGWSALRYALWRLRRGLATEEFDRRLVLNRPVWSAPDREHAVRKNLRLVEALGIALGPEDDARPEIPERASDHAFAEESLAPLAGRGDLVGLHLGSPSSYYAKIWPVERWAEVARRLRESRGCAFVLVGGRAEQESAERFQDLYRGPVANAIGARFLETCAVIRRCRLFLGADTGPVKAAMALGTPTVTVWGPTNRVDNGVFWDPTRHRDARIEVPCAPCVHMGLPAEGAGVINFTNCGHRRCMADLTPEIVVQVVEQALEAAIR